MGKSGMNMDLFAKLNLQFSHVHRNQGRCWETAQGVDKGEGGRHGEQGTWLNRPHFCAVKGMIIKTGHHPPGQSSSQDGACEPEPPDLPGRLGAGTTPSL